LESCSIFPFYRAREIVKLAQDGLVDNKVFISETLYGKLATEYGVPKKDDLMISAVGTLGACYVVQAADKFYFKDASVLRFSPKTKLCSRYFFHAFRTRIILDQVKSGGGSTVGTYTIERAKRTKIRIPPLAEQQRIAEQLDTADRILRLREQAIAKLDQLVQSVFMEMFGDLLAKHGHWQRIKLGDLKVSKRGSIDPAKHPSEIFTLYSIPAYDMKKQEVLPGSSIGSTKLLVQNGDVLLSKIVPHIRRAWVVGDEYKNRQIASSEWIVFSSDRIMPKVLRYLLISDTFHKRFMTTVAGIGGSLVRAQPRLVSEFEISLPPLELQQRFDAFENEFQAKRTLLERSRMDLLRLNASIRNRAFSAN
jgi:type I restriction enzyme, S subunit